MAGNKISELTALSEITSGDLFIVTDDTTSASRRVAWSAIEASINIDNTEGNDSAGSTRYTYDNGIGVGPGSGEVRFNSTTPSLANLMYISETDKAGNDQSGLMNVALKKNNEFVMYDINNTANYVRYKITQNATDYGNYRAVPLKFKAAGGFPSDGATVGFSSGQDVFALEAAQDFELASDTATAIDFKEGDDSYIKIDTSSSAKKITVGQDVTFSSSILNTVTIKSDNINQGSVRIYQGDNSTDAPDLRLYKSRGTVASPTTVSATDVLTRISAYAYEGAQYVQAGNIGFIASDGDGNGSFELRTRVSDTLSPRISVNSSGETIIAGDLIQNPGSSVTPATNGQLQVEATSNTVLTFKYKGSDGVVRSGTLALS